MARPRASRRPSPASRRRLRQGAGLLLAAALWSWPVAGPVEIARHYLAPPTAYSAGHRGIDVASAVGAEIRAPEAGVVHFAGWVVDRPVLSIRHAGGVVSSFEPVEAVVAVGEPVARGQLVGRLVASPASHCAVPCLHLGARVDGEYVNPLLFLGGLPRSVLLPTRGFP